MEKFTVLTEKLVVLNHLQREYEAEVEKIIKFEKWYKVSNKPMWEYTGPTGSKARLSRLRLTMNEIRLELERGL